MKKLFLLLGLSSLVASSSFAGQGGQFVRENMINGQFLIVSNNATIEPILSGSNIAYVDFNNILRWSMFNTNLVPTTGQSGTNYNPAAFYWTNSQAFVSTNALAGGYVSNGFIMNSPATIDVTGWVDGVAQPGLGVFSITTYGIGSTPQNVAGAPTNTLTVTLLKSADGLNFSYGGKTVNYDFMQFALSASAGTNFTYMTNIPATFMQGARKIRFEVTSSNVASGTNVIISDASVNGFVP